MCDPLDPQVLHQEFESVTISISDQDVTYKVMHVIDEHANLSKTLTLSFFWDFVVNILLCLYFSIIFMIFNIQNHLNMWSGTSNVTTLHRHWIFMMKMVPLHHIYHFLLLQLTLEAIFSNYDN